MKSFLFTPGYSRLVLPHKAPDKEIIHVPYLRFKGNVYFCKDKTVGYRFIDITRPGIPLKAIPPSLGVRPQAMKMRFVTPDTRGSFLRFSLKATDILTDAGRLAGDLASGRILHRAYIGETLSLIYLPLYVKQNRIFDAVLNRPVTVLPDDQDIFQQTTGSRSRWGPRFMATLCPQCGWNLEGERDSVVLICSNCDTVWQASKGRFTEVKYSVVEGRKADTTYLPFWSILADTRGVEINSYANFLRVRLNSPAIRPPRALKTKQNWTQIYAPTWEGYFIPVPRGSSKNKFTFSGVEAPACQGARTNSSLFNQSLTSIVVTTYATTLAIRLSENFCPRCSDTFFRLRCYGTQHVSINQKLCADDLQIF
ncbi:MAG: hypothetical protein ACNY01_00590 [Desulfobacteria bacterium]